MEEIFSSEGFLAYEKDAGKAGTEEDVAGQRVLPVISLTLEKLNFEVTIALSTSILA